MSWSRKGQSWGAGHRSGRVSRSRSEPTTRGPGATLRRGEPKISYPVRPVTSGGTLAGRGADGCLGSQMLGRGKSHRRDS